MLPSGGSMKILAFVLAVTGAARADLPFVATKAVCFRVEMDPRSTAQAPVYRKAELASLAPSPGCAKGTTLAALCDKYSRTQYQGDFSALWRSTFQRDHLLSADIQSQCSAGHKIGTATNITKDMNTKGKFQQEVGG